VSVRRMVVIAGALAATLGWPDVLCGAGATEDLPPAAAKVLRAHFPGAAITAVGRERERGAWFYEVDLVQSGCRVSAEVSEDGVIGEIEARVALDDVPPAVLDKLRQRLGDGRITRVERHERHGIARSGRFVQLKTPRVLYEVKYVTRDGLRREVQIVSDEIMELPREVLARLAASVPGARIVEVEVEDDDGVLLFVLSLQRNGEPFEVTADRQGRIVESEVPVARADVPSAVATALAGNREVRASDTVEVRRWESFAVVVDCVLVPRHEIGYAVRLTRSDRQRELRFDGSGRLTTGSEWESIRGEDDDGGDGGD
jgi:uncharacterized membrane protein YkoI